MLSQGSSAPSRDSAKPQPPSKATKFRLREQSCSASDEDADLACPGLTGDYCLEAWFSGGAAGVFARVPMPISMAVFLGKTTSRPRAMKWT
jgi:hypothetical protein